MKKVRMARDGYILMSIIFYITGIVYMFLPSVSPLAVCISSGIILVLYGIVKMIGYFSGDLYDLAFQYDLACGVFLIVVGIIALGCNLRIRQYLSPALGLLILLDAVLKLQTSRDACTFGIKKWNWMLAFSIATAVFGVMIIIKPFAGVRMSHVIVGCGLLAEGFMNHLTVKETVQITNGNALLDQNEEDTNE